MIDTLRSLIRLALLEERGEPSAPMAAAVTGVAEPEWAAILEELDAHRITPLVAHALRSCGLDDQLPEAIRARLRESYRATQWINEVHTRELRAVIRAFRAAGVEPIVFKGVILSAGFYPDPGTRPMVDLDLLIRPPELRRVTRALRALGYARRVDDGERSANGFRNGLGLTIDLHWRFDLFPESRRQELLQQLPLPGFEAPVTTWDANALLVHLAFHAFDHRPKLGLRLSWLLDFAFVVRAAADQLDLQRLRALAPSPESFHQLQLALAFLQREFGFALPPHLATATAVDGLSLARVLRDGRSRPWGLPGWSGWFHVIGSRLLRRSKSTRRYPRLTDLPLLVFDRLAERATMRRLAATRATP